MQAPNQPVDIVIPVYAGYEESLACINSVVDSLELNKSRAELVVIFDAGPDLTLREALLDLASQNKITLLINENNQGFVCCINKGIMRSDRDVLLLNSDTLVANDWLDRLLARAYTSSNIATVTPFSNNAEICSWPELCSDNHSYDHLTVAEIDAGFASLKAPLVDIPTAVGFCMFIKRSVIDRIGVFDAETFGRGYGEENDFCMRASALNFRHVLATDVYVEHKGGVSFGDEKQERVARAMQILDERYPSYHAIVAKHIEEDPARKWRFAAELVLRGRQGLPLVLHISHGIGGGTDRHVIELARYCADQLQHAMLVPQANCMRLVFPNVECGGLFEFPFNETRELKNFLFALGLARIHIHHIKGWESHIADLLKLLDVPFDVTLHDYYFLHINPALTDKRGYFVADSAQRDEICAEAIAFPRGISGEQWRKPWAKILNRAERVFAPSLACAAIYSEYFPDLRMSCAYHPDSEYLQSYPAVRRPEIEADRALHVVVIGALSVIKGANILERAAILADRKNLPLRFTLLGYAYKKLVGSVHTLGAYQDHELHEKLANLQADLVWFPCTWPETYSYTLSSALDQGLPVICPNIGAFPERLQNRPFTWIEDWQLSPEEWLQRLLAVREEFRAGTAESSWSTQPVSEYSYQRQYRHASVAPELAVDSVNQLMSYWLRELPEASTVNRRFYRALIWLNSHWVFGHIANLVPMWVRRSVKRKLSTRPLHE